MNKNKIITIFEISLIYFRHLSPIEDFQIFSRISERNMSAFDFKPKQSIKQQVQNKHIRYNNIHISSSGEYPLDSLSAQNEESVDLSISLP